MSGSAATSLAAHAVPARPIAARTRMLLDAPIVPTLLRLAAPNTCERQRGMRPLMLLAALAFAGCDTGPGIPPTPAQNATVSSVTSHQHALRVKLDTARSRLWVLGVDRVDVYDASTGALIRRIALPGWSVADAVCGPDIAFDGTGTAFISHNVEARLWQIDGNSFEIKERTIRLVNHEQLDIGFGSLAFAPDGTLFGTGSMGGSLWRIDLSKSRAHRVEPYVRAWDACDVR